MRTRQACHPLDRQPAQGVNMGTRKAKSAATVDEFVAGLAQPLKAEVESLRRVILSAAAGIGEELKWNAPSFHTRGHFATMRLNGKVLLQLILPPWRQEERAAGRRDR
jgi:hypothetical protein